jgi:hypothetical protein
MAPEVCHKFKGLIGLTSLSELHAKLNSSSKVPFRRRGDLDMCALNSFQVYNSSKEIQSK